MNLKRFEAGKTLESQLTESRLNAIVDAINANQLQQGVGIRISRNNGGATISVVQDRIALDVRPFTPYLKSEEEGFYQIRVYDGFVYECTIAGEQAFKEYTPDGIKDGDEPIWHDIQIGQALYCTCNIGIGGTIQDNPVIEVMDDDAEGEHYKPAIGDFSGTSGTHRYKLCKLKEDGTLEMHNAGQNLYHYAERGAMKNLQGSGGSVYNVLKDYTPDDDTVNFRTIIQKDGDGQPIIDDSSGDSILFKRCKGITGTDGQLQVLDGDGAILFRGNEVNAEITAGQRVSMKVVDGFVTELSATPDPDPPDPPVIDGWWGTINFTFTASESYVTADLGFESGLLKTVAVNSTPITGTEASPGSAAVDFFV